MYGLIHTAKCLNDNMVLKMAACASGMFFFYSLAALLLVLYNLLAGLHVRPPQCHNDMGVKARLRHELPANGTFLLHCKHSLFFVFQPPRHVTTITSHLDVSSRWRPHSHFDGSRKLSSKTRISHGPPPQLRQRWAKEYKILSANLSIRH
jgi:hypothetical protein